MSENEQSIIPTISGASTSKRFSKRFKSFHTDTSIHHAKRKSKSITFFGCVLCVLSIAIMCILVGCGEAGESEPVLSEDELEQAEYELEQTKIAECQNLEFEHAEELEAAGKYGGACKLYEDLIKQGIHAIVLQPHCDELNHRREIESFVRICISNRESEFSLWNKLEDPNSLVIYGLEITTTYSDTRGLFVYNMRADYGAANSHGGMDRKTFIYDIPNLYIEEDEVEGKVIDVSFIDLDRLTMDDDEWNDAVYGDWEKYSSKYKENPDNIWNY